LKHAEMSTHALQHGGDFRGEFTAASLKLAEDRMEQTRLVAISAVNSPRPH